MKIMVAQSTASMLAGHEPLREALSALLEGEGHKVQTLDLPSIAHPRRAITNLASFRLMGTAASADTLICLDPVATMLSHPRKLALLLDDTYLASDAASLPDESALARDFIANILHASLEEARHIFVLSRFAQKRLRQLAVDRSEVLRPQFPFERSPHRRHPGSELLVLHDIDEWQRPELLTACLAALPEPFRARWIASRAKPASLAHLIALIRDADLEQRVAVDVRTIGNGERSYLLSQAACLLELAPQVLAAGAYPHRAHRLGVPVISCIDGGALSEMPEQGGIKPVKPDGAALAKAVLAACAAPDVKGSAMAGVTSVAPSWAPLVKALSK